MAPDADEVAEMYRDGMTGTEIAEELGAPTSTVYYHLNRSDVEMRRPGARRIDLPVDEILERWRSGESLKALSEEYGASRLAIKTRVRERGYETSQDHYEYEDGLEDYLDDIRALADELGREPTYREYLFQGELRLHTIMHRESLTWSELKEKAGVVD